VPSKTTSKEKFVRLRTVVYDKRSSEISVSDTDEDNYYYSRGTLNGIQKTRNIMLAITQGVKDVQFIKGFFNMRRATKRDTEKKFGRIFNTNGFIR
jgi:hypothetical protein